VVRNASELFYSGQLAAGSTLRMGCAPETGIMGRR
jgi:hypothetical protein